MRAQTPIDYAVGMGLFLVTLVVVIGFLPSVFGPFEAQTGAQSVAAERSADRLADDLLATDPGSPAVVNGSCAQTFFDAAGDGSTCRYGGDADTLTDALGVDDIHSVNVTIQDGSEIRTISGVDLAAGPDEGGNDYVAAERVVLLGGEANRLVVKVW